MNKSCSSPASPPLRKVQFQTYLHLPWSFFSLTISPECTLFYTQLTRPLFILTTYVLVRVCSSTTWIIILITVTFHGNSMHFPLHSDVFAPAIPFAWNNLPSLRRSPVGELLFSLESRTHIFRAVILTSLCSRPSLHSSVAFTVLFWNYSLTRVPITRQDWEHGFTLCQQHRIKQCAT